MVCSSSLVACISWFMVSSSSLVDWSSTTRAPVGRTDNGRSRTHFLAISLYALPTGSRQLVGRLIGHDDRRDEHLRLTQIEGTQVGHQAASLLLGRLVRVGQRLLFEAPGILL
jgi:hypothetical protein